MNHAIRISRSGEGRASTLKLFGFARFVTGRPSSRSWKHPQAVDGRAKGQLCLGRGRRVFDTRKAMLSRPAEQIALGQSLVLIHESQRLFGAADGDLAFRRGTKDNWSPSGVQGVLLSMSHRERGIEKKVSSAAEGRPLSVLRARSEQGIQLSSNEAEGGFGLVESGQQKRPGEGQCRSCESETMVARPGSVVPQILLKPHSWSD